MRVDYSFEVKNIEICVPAFFKHDNSSVNTVYPERLYFNDFFSPNLLIGAGRDFENKIDSGGSSPNLKSPSDSTNSSINSDLFKVRILDKLC